MSSPFKFLSALDVANASGGDVSYIRVLNACRNGEVNCQKQAGTFVILEEDAQAFLAKCREQNDPLIFDKLKAEIGRLKLENEALKARVTK